MRVARIAVVVVMSQASCSDDAAGACRAVASCALSAHWNQDACACVLDEFPIDSGGACHAIGSCALPNTEWSQAACDCVPIKLDSGLDGGATMHCGNDGKTCCPLGWHESGSCSQANLRCFTECSGHIDQEDGGREMVNSQLYCGTDGIVGAGKGLFPCTPDP